ncbi:splicing regulator SDE2 [Neocloeon triangulifer]|uniref:splicing regulator SDE2 n=1 Tax=Neocloeon triangulifer TaxID=2078957 RepID=UPI00286F1EE7|nr:splicing regulator SDE2 [Neocloeon triangulifer]
MEWLSKDKFIVRDGLDPSAEFFQKIEHDFYMTLDGKAVLSLENVQNGSVVHIVPRVLGGKGGFGSMLRAIGAQIEKTTNREACRDLSGRRLRDINEEKRLKNWINNKAELDKEKKEKRRKKLEKMVEEPKIAFKDNKYEEARSEMTEKVADALEHGLKAAAGVSGVKRVSSTEPQTKKKKKKIWGMDDEDLSDSEDESEEEGSAQKSSDDDQSSGSASEVKCT